MNKFIVHKGIVVPLDRANVDTDAIIPKQFLKSIHRTGFGANLFDEWRYLDHGEPGMDNSKRAINPDFILNQVRYQNASILLTRKNFGCGSSREHAPWALEQFGFRAIIASSYADIFYNNCFKNGILAIVLPETAIDTLMNKTKATGGYQLEVDLERQTISTANDSLHFTFDIDEFRKHCLLNGLDDIALTLRSVDKIREFETRHLASQPWLANSI
ncbi:MAG: leuD [Solimicrobium sp.]|nr:leuD [Solimicrobium sp.]